MQTQTADWLLRNARIHDQSPLRDVAITQGTISQIAPSLQVEAHNQWDLAGRLLLPGLIDIHTHLDKTYFEIPNRSGTLGEAIQLWRAEKHRDAANRVRTSVRRALRNAIALGTTAIRSHVDIDVAADLIALEAILEVKEEFRAAIDVQIVVLAFAGRDAEADRILQSALALGVDFIGGAPALEPDPASALKAAFAAAERSGKPLDLHIDETEDPTMRTLELLAELTIAHGMQGRVSAGHCCSLAFMKTTDAERIIDKVAKAGIHVFTLPSCNLVLMGRAQQPAPRGLTRVKALLDAGVNVCAASDNVCDPFNPLGNYDLLHSANLTSHAAHMTGTQEIEACLRMVTLNPAKAMGIANHGIAIGGNADLVVVDAHSVGDVIATIPARLGTFKNGKLIIRQEIRQAWSL